MKRIKSNHLWRRGATLLLAMLMLFTCVGSALPAFAEEAAGNTATVDSGDPVLADSSASGDSTGDTGTDLPDDPQRPTLPSGEDISEEAPPADESDGETVPPADSDSSEDPAAPDSGDSIPDESESEPAEQPGEGDADLPEDEQPSGEEPDPDEDEEIPENEPEDEPFEALVILDPENGAAVQAGVGEEVTFKAPVSREDVAVAYQWQRFQKPAAGSVQTEALYDYAEGETTEYWYALDDMREAEALAMNPDMLWPGIEMYYATVAALDEIGADSSDVSIAWKTPKFHGIQTFLTVDKVDIAQHGTHFRVKYTAISSHGTKMEWYSNIADEKSGAWTTDTGMFGGDVSQSIKNNSNILNVKRPELEIITTPSALCGGAPYIDTMTPDEYGQMLLLSNAAATMANGTAKAFFDSYYEAGFFDVEGNLLGFPEEVPEDELAQEQPDTDIQEILDSTEIEGGDGEMAGFPGEGRISADEEADVAESDETAADSAAVESASENN